MCIHWDTIWSFRTRRFIVALDVTPDDLDPVGSFASGDDEQDSRDVEFCREGGAHWFQARVSVAYVDNENPRNWAVTPKVVLGRDYLGGCSYNSFAEFTAPGSGYFRDMVSEAIGEARETLARMTKGTT